jgi:hypothetical protein
LTPPTAEQSFGEVGLFEAQFFPQLLKTLTVGHSLKHPDFIDKFKYP